MQVKEFIELLENVQQQGDGYIAKCPAHEDNKNSLSIAEGDDGRVLVNCFAGCSHQEVVRSLGLQEKDLFNSTSVQVGSQPNASALGKSEKPKSEPKPKKETKEKKLLPELPTKFGKSFITKRYEYKNAEGEVIYVVCRTESKDFPVFTKVEGGWTAGRTVPAVPYKYPELIRGIAENATIYIVEGEKDVETMIAHGFCATTVPGGGGTWLAEYNNIFRDCNVVLLPDNDPTGKKQAKKICENIGDLAKTLKIVNLPVANEKEDVTDFFEHYGGTAERLEQIMASALFYKNQLQPQLQVKEDNHSEREYADLYELRDLLHTDETHIRIIPKHFCEEMLKRCKIAASKIGKQRKYFIYKEGFWQEISTDILGKYIINWFSSRSATSENIEKVLKLLPSIGDVYVNEHDWDASDNLINLNNCTFNFETMQAQPHDPKDRFTYKLPFDYDHDAICPTFDASLALYSCNDDSWVNAFWEVAGYAMYGEYPFQKMFWFTGSKGRNGKGTCIRIIESLVGEKYTVSDIDTRDFREKFYKARLIGKRLATAGDLHNRLANVSSLKQLTGGDRQTTDIKFSDAKSFTSKAKFIFAMNQLPKLPPEENITPIAKRIMILPFDFQITNPDQTVEERIYKEMSGIFNRAIEGLQRLLKQRKFTYVKRGADVLDRFQNSDTLLSDFLDRLIYKENCKRELLFTSVLYGEYCEYMKINYGHNWELNKDVIVKSSYDLYSVVRNHFEEKGLKILSELSHKEKNKAEAGRTERYYPNIYFKTAEDYELEEKERLSKESPSENQILIQDDSMPESKNICEYPFEKEIEF